MFLIIKYIVTFQNVVLNTCFQFKPKHLILFMKEKMLLAKQVSYFDTTNNLIIIEDKFEVFNNLVLGTGTGKTVSIFYIRSSAAVWHYS